MTGGATSTELVGVVIGGAAVAAPAVAIVAAAQTTRIIFFMVVASVNVNGEKQVGSSQLSDAADESQARCLGKDSR